MLIALNMLSHCFLYLRLTLIYPSQYSVLFCLALKRYLCTGCNVVTPVCLFNPTLPYLLQYTLYLLLCAFNANLMFHSLSLSNMAAQFANSSSPHSTQWSTYSSSYSPASFTHHAGLSGVLLCDVAFSLHTSRCIKPPLLLLT